MTSRDRVISGAAFTMIAIGIAVIAVFAIRPWGTSARAVQHTPIELSASVRHAAPSAHASLPSWVHWAPASSRAAREVCGRGVAAITVWGGSGDTSAVVCGNGKADAS